MRSFTKYALIFILSAFMFTANAQKFGFVNTQEIIQLLPEVKEANANIDAHRKQLQKQGQNMVTSLQTKYQDLERKQAQGELSPKQLEEEAAKLKEDEMKIAEFEQNSQKQIVDKSESLLQPIRDKIQKAIDDVATENGYTYIFDYSTGFVLYADPANDVSALVRAKLGI